MTTLKTETAKDIKATAVDAIEATESTLLKARKVARTGALAYVGMFGMAFDFASKRVSKLTEGREELMADLVKRGETLEGQALTAANDAKGRVTKLYTEGSEKVRDVVPGLKGDRVEELEGEVEKLSKKIKALNAKTSKTAAKKTTTKKTVAKKAA